MQDAFVIYCSRDTGHAYSPTLVWAYPSRHTESVASNADERARQRQRLAGFLLIACAVIDGVLIGWEYLAARLASTNDPLGGLAVLGAIFFYLVLWAPVISISAATGALLVGVRIRRRALLVVAMLATLPQLALTAFFGISMLTEAAQSYASPERLIYTLTWVPGLCALASLVLLISVWPSLRTERPAQPVKVAT